MITQQARGCAARLIRYVNRTTRLAGRTNFRRCTSSRVTLPRSICTTPRLPGGRKIFPSALQALVNLIDHGMALQEAVEAPRVWTEGPVLEVEPGIPETVRQGLLARGHKLKAMPTVAGGMNAIAFDDDGGMTGAACWRADGTAAALGGGLARAGVRFELPR